MALHTQLPIYKTGSELLSLAFKVQEQMPRGVKAHLGNKVNHHCMEMLDGMAMANATKGAERAAHIHELLKHLRATTVLLRIGHDARYISHKLWAQSVLLLDSIGRQGGGWLKKSATRKVPAA